MIGQRTPEQTELEMKAAYEIATIRDNDVCQRCRRPGRVVHRDHRQNRRRGNTVASNLQLLCAIECHPWKTAHPRDAVADGWSVPSWADPAEWPARRWLPSGHGTLRLAWVIYDNEGYWVEIPEYEAHERMGGG